jgi:hypothetical protein
MGRPTVPDLSWLKLTFDEELFMEKRMENDTDGDPIYVGWAAAGTQMQSKSWFIIKITYDGNKAVVRSQTASGIPVFGYIWNDRASYF